MAMLAEPKRKVKYSINPNGLDWSKDSSKFGQKLMEKMGWQTGKGLGANEDGHVDHVSVRAKQDNKGVGCTAKHADNWIAHQDDFNSLLANLNQDHGDESETKAKTDKVHSLEAKSKNSKARVHYHKFAKGKDLSMRNEEEMNSIFGKRKSMSEPATPQVQSEANSDTETHSDDNSTTKHHGVITTTSSTNIQEYFAQKMAQLKAAREKGNTNNTATPQSKDSSEPTEPMETEISSVSKKKSKKKKKKVFEENEESEKEDSVGVVVSGEKSKKEKKAKGLVGKSDSNELNDLASNDCTDDKKSKKRKKNRAVENEGEVVDKKQKLDSVSTVQTDVQEDVMKTKKTKSKKNKDVSPAEELNEQVDDSSKPKKEKKCKKRNKEKDNSVKEDLKDDVVECESEEVSSDKKKAKKSKKKAKIEKVESNEKIKGSLNGSVIVPDKFKSDEREQLAKSVHFPGSNIQQIQGYGVSGKLVNE